MDSLREADILGSEVINGEPRLKLGRANDNTGIAGDVALWGPDGYFAVPNPAGGGEAACAMCVQEGSRWRAFACKDNRFAEKTGDMQPGDRMIVTDGEARFVIKQANDSITIYTVNQDTELSMMVHLDGANGVANVVNGNSQITLNDKKILLAVNGGGSIVIDEEGVHIGGKQFNADCGSGTLGTIGPARPQPGVNAVVMGPSGMTAVGSTGWTVAP